MQFLFKIIVVFLIVFNFRVPVFYNSAFVSILLSAIYYIYRRGTIPFTYFFQRYNAVILIGNIILAFIAFLIPFFHHTDVVSTLEKRLWVQFMMLWATIFALPLLIEKKESNALEELSILICYAYAIQGVISLVAFLYAPLGDFLFNMKPDPIKATALDPAANIPIFRLYNLSSIYYVELAAAFGIAFIVFFWLQLKSIHPYISGWKKYPIFIFIFLGTAFAGRTGFLGLLLGLGGWLFFSYNNFFAFIKRNVGYIIGFFVILFVAYSFILPAKQRQLFTDELFPFAFEWYYSYKESGTFKVNSMEATTSQHYYYLKDETLLEGHGLTSDFTPIYPHSDAGYMNTLIFGGIPLLLCLLIYQSLYFIRPIAIAQKNNIRNNRINTGFFILFFLYILIVDIKTPALGYLHVAEVMYLALGSGYIIQYYLQKEQGEITG